MVADGSTWNIGTHGKAGGRRDTGGYPQPVYAYLHILHQFYHVNFVDLGHHHISVTSKKRGPVSTKTSYLV